jgi:outer membrane immunogenic protein
MPVKAVRPMPIADPWTGVYAGLNVGYSWGSANAGLTVTQQQGGTITETTLGGTVLSVTNVPVTTTTASFANRAKMDGWLGGGQIGYNWKTGNWLLGVEGDLQATGEKGNARFCLTAGCPVGSTFAQGDFHLRWFGTLRGRTGLVWDNLLLYVTGGLAAGQFSADYALGTVGAAALTATGGGGNTRFGYAVGGGGEYRFSERWSVKLEYLYMDLGGNSASLNGSVNSLPIIITVGDRRFIGVATTNTQAAFNTRFTDNILRAGINYRF